MGAPRKQTPVIERGVKKAETTVGTKTCEMLALEALSRLHAGISEIR
jgi:hypothetical protein